jgi:hypothetical protein
MTKAAEGERSEEDTKRLRDEVVRRMLNTPPKPHPKPKPGRRPGRPIAS